MFRSFVALSAVGFSWCAANAQTSAYFCKFDDRSPSVLCVQQGKSDPVLQFGLNVNSKLFSLIINNQFTSIDRRSMYNDNEQFRLDLEQFRSSLEKLRTKAEDVRASLGDVGLYSQIMSTGLHPVPKTPS